MGQQKTRKNKKISNIHQKNDLFKTSKSQRYSNYPGFGKSRVASRTLTAVRWNALLDPFLATKLKFEVHFGTPRNPKGHQKSTISAESGAFGAKNAIHEASRSDSRKMDKKGIEK